MSVIWEKTRSALIRFCPEKLNVAFVSSCDEVLNYITDRLCCSGGGRTELSVRAVVFIHCVSAAQWRNRLTAVCLLETPSGTPGGPQTQKHAQQSVCLLKINFLMMLSGSGSLSDGSWSWSGRSRSFAVPGELAGNLFFSFNKAASVFSTCVLMWSCLDFIWSDVTLFNGFYH